MHALCEFPTDRKGNPSVAVLPLPPNGICCSPRQLRFEVQQAKLILLCTVTRTQGSTDMQLHGHLYIGLSLCPCDCTWSSCTTAQKATSCAVACIWATKRTAKVVTQQVSVCVCEERIIRHSCTNDTSCTCTDAGALRY